MPNASVFDEWMRIFTLERTYFGDEGLPLCLTTMEMVFDIILND